jgi:energy-coupling factor transport system ATP-binding protein
MVEECKPALKNWYESAEEVNSEVDQNVILELKNIDYGYTKNQKILNDVSFKINRGEIVSILGKNGAGKSTLSKLICGFYKPTSGQIVLEGSDMKNMTIKERAEHIGLVLQNPNQMISQINIFDEVALGLKIRKMDEKEIEEKVYEALKICGLYEFRNWPISALSFGQKKRVTIASILVLNPKIIILDEPTAGQDYRHYNEIMEFLLELNKKGITIIMITHDLHLMLEYTNRAIVLSDGQKIAEDTAHNILTDSRIIELANLKETSLYQLAKKANFEDPRDFVKRFIDYDRKVRNT